MKQSAWKWVGACALALAAMPQLAQAACPKDGEKKPSEQLCPDGDKDKTPPPPSDQLCPDGTPQLG